MTMAACSHGRVRGGLRNARKGQAAPACRWPVCKGRRHLWALHPRAKVPAWLASPAGDCPA
ncbi:unnamed protein product [Musa textilis]